MYGITAAALLPSPKRIPAGRKSLAPTFAQSRIYAGVHFCKSKARSLVLITQTVSVYLLCGSRPLCGSLPLCVGRPLCGRPLCGSVPCGSLPSCV